MPVKDQDYINEKPPARAKAGGKSSAKSKKSARNTRVRYEEEESSPLFGEWVANTNWPELLKDLSGLILLVLGIVVLFSLFSFDPGDLSLNVAGESGRIQNWIGPVGANIASSLYSTFGWPAWLIPLVLLSAGWFLLRPPQLNIEIVKMLGWLLMLVSVIGLLALSDLGRPQNGYFNRGGWIGQLFVRDGLVSRLNEFGALLLLGALLLAGLILSTPFSLSWLPRFVDDLLPGDQSGWFDSLRYYLGSWGTSLRARDEGDEDFAPRRASKSASRSANVMAGKGGLSAKERKARIAAVNNAVIGRKAGAVRLAGSEVVADEEFEIVDDLGVAENEIEIAKDMHRAIAPAAVVEDDAAAGKFKRWTNSLRGEQPVLPLKKGAGQPLAALPVETEDFETSDGFADTDDSTDPYADEIVDDFAGSDYADDGLPAPPRPPHQRTVDEMLASATVKRIESPELAEAKESKLSKLVKSAAQLMANYRLPDSEMLTEAAPRPDVADDDLMDRARQLAEKCAEFNVSGKVTRISPGPVVTTFEFKPDPGVKYSRITGLVDDLCLGLKAESVRIDRIPGKSTVGIEVPNQTRETIRLREVIESKEFRESRAKLPLALGKSIYGANYVAELEKMPHLLIAGATGAGKSVGLNSILISLLYKASPAEVKLILVDPKRLELGLYADIPHLLTPIVTDAKRASYALKWAVAEMENRYKHLATFSVRNIDQYNQEVRNNPDLKPIGKSEELPQPLPYIVVIIDELADLMMVSARDVEESITRLAQMARAVGIHLILATQRPSVDVITGLIKANFPSRIAFRVSSKVDSRTIIDSNGAEGLLGQGDMLFLPPGTSRLVRVHGAYVDEKEVKRVCDFIRAQGAPAYDERVTMSDKEVEGSDGNEQPRDEKYYEAVKVVIEMGRASTSALQRRLRIGYGRAASIIDMMEREGVVGPEEGASKPRQVLVKADFLERVAQIREEEY